MSKLEAGVLVRIVRLDGSVFWPIRFAEANSMLYWLGVYALVVTAVLLPFLFLYLTVAVSWLGLAAIRFMLRNLKSAFAIRTGL